MTREELINKVNEVLSEEFEADVADMQPDASLMGVLDLDSLDIVDVVVLVEKNFGYVMKKKISHQSRLLPISMTFSVKDWISASNGIAC